MACMITHLVLFTWKPGTDPADVDRLQRELVEFAAGLDGCLGYTAAPSAGLREGVAEFAVVADFVDEEAWRAYAEHPDHLRIIEERIAPIAASRTATQLRR